MTSQRRKTETERFGWERAHHLINEKCGVESRLIELCIRVPREFRLRHAYSSDRIGSPRSASAR
jgi:hypothetical protein